MVLSCAAEGCTSSLHADCAQELLSRTPRCPVCRRGVDQTTETLHGHLAGAINVLRRDLAALRRDGETRERMCSEQSLALGQLQEANQVQALAMLALRETTATHTRALQAQVRNLVCFAEMRFSQQQQIVVNSVSVAETKSIREKKPARSGPSSSLELSSIRGNRLQCHDLDRRERSRSPRRGCAAPPTESGRRVSAMALLRDAHEPPIDPTSWRHLQGVPYVFAGI